MTFKQFRENDEQLPSVRQLSPLLQQLAQAAQQVYDQWDQVDGYDEELGSGGICQDIAERMASVLLQHGIDAITIDNGGIGEQHVWVIAKFAEGVYSIDIQPYVYERGSGYTWTKVPGVIFTPQHIDIDQLSNNPDEFSMYEEY